MANIVISENSLAENMMLPMYGKKLYMDLYPELLIDKGFKDLLDKTGYDYKKRYPLGIKAQNAKLGAVESGLKAKGIATEISRYLEKHPRACIVNLCCGLDTTYTIADNGNARIYNVDSEENIEIRNELIPESGRVHNIVGTMTDTDWFDSIIWKKEHGIVFYALNAFYYYKKEDVRTLFQNLAEHFEGGMICFDACIREGLKGVLNDSDNVSEYFALNDPEAELKTWSNKFKTVKYNGVFTGYGKMDKRYGLKIRMIGKAGDQTRMSQINTIQFK